MVDQDLQALSLQALLDQGQQEPVLKAPSGQGRRPDPRISGYSPAGPDDELCQGCVKAKGQLFRVLSGEPPL